VSPITNTGYAATSKNKPGDMLSFTSQQADKDISKYEFVVLLNKEQDYPFCLLVVKFLDV
jgi:hypothetical protein